MPCDKTCSKCKCTKGIDKFLKKGSWCKDCNKEYMKEYHAKNRMILAEKQKIYVANNKDKVDAYQKKYAAAGKEEKKIRNARYISQNKEILAEKRKQYYLENAETIKAKVRTRKQNRTPEQKEQDRIRINAAERLRLQTDLDYKIKKYVSSRVRNAVKKGLGRKSDSTLELVGCSNELLRAHLEAQFQQGMTWDNYGEWHLDHRLPCAMFDLTQDCEQTLCFHYSNLQPMWGPENIKKGAKVSDEDAILTSLYLLFQS